MRTAMPLPALPHPKRCGGGGGAAVRLLCVYRTRRVPSDATPTMQADATTDGGHRPSPPATTTTNINAIPPPLRPHLQWCGWRGANLRLGARLRKSVLRTQRLRPPPPDATATATATTTKASAIPPPPLRLHLRWCGRRGAELAFGSVSLKRRFFCVARV